MRGMIRSAVVATGLAVALGSPSPVAGSALPPDFDADLASEFLDEILDVLGPDGPDDAADLDDLLGEPGDLDATPGEPVVLVLAADAAAAAADADDLGGSSLSGPCQGIAVSFDDEGRIIDIAADFDDAAPPIDLLAYYTDGTVEAAFTSGNPFRVHVDGAVAYAGVAGGPGAGPRNHTWSITTFGQALDSGGDDNPDGENRNAGAVDLGEQLPAAAKVSAKFRISGKMVADDGFACTGSGYFETEGGAPIAQAVGGALVVLAGIGLIFNARPARTWSG